MIAYEVFVDGSKLCTAGVGEYGVMSVLLTWVRRPGKEREDSWEPRYEVTGISIDSEAGVDHHVFWAGERLPVGSDLRVRVVESQDVDAPAVDSESPSPKQMSSEEHQRALYERLKAKFDAEEGP